MNWQILVIICLLNIVIYNQFFKVATNNMKKAGALTALIQLVGGLTSLLFLPFFEWKLPSNLWLYGILFLSIVIWGISNRLSTIVRDKVEASVISVISQLYVHRIERIYCQK